MKSIHLSTARKMLQNAEPVDLQVWTQKGEIVTYTGVTPLRYDYYAGTRTIKLPNSSLVRKVRDVCIHRINDMEVYL